MTSPRLSSVNHGAAYPTRQLEAWVTPLKPRCLDGSTPWAALERDPTCHEEHAVGNRVPKSDHKSVTGDSVTPIPRPPLSETAEERAARVARLRNEFLEGRLDLRVDPESDGVERLLHDVFSLGRTRRRRR